MFVCFYCKPVLLGVVITDKDLLYSQLKISLKKNQSLLSRLPSQTRIGKHKDDGPPLVDLNLVSNNCLGDDFQILPSYIEIATAVFMLCYNLFELDIS